MAELIHTPQIMVGQGWDDYALVDSGNLRKFERYGPYHFIRPDAQALWQPRLAQWNADAEFIPGADEDGGGKWHYYQTVPTEGWPLQRGEVYFHATCTPFRHLGFFPDMAPVWDWMGERLVPPPSSLRDATSPVGGGFSTLNLFGYTGVGTLALSQYGPVTHVDASKKSVMQARANADFSSMATRAIRWLVDDAGKFAAREVRRGRRYDGIILDPPKFGRGPEGEVWRLEEHLPALIADCRALLDDNSRFLFLTAYAVRMSSLALAGLLDEAFAGMGGVIEHGDLAVRETGDGGRLLPTAIFARWRNDKD
jgi:23S rRNA (cytosine1962-C5)-methyltransferase